MSSRRAPDTTQTTSQILPNDNEAFGFYLVARAESVEVDTATERAPGSISTVPLDRVVACSQLLVDERGYLAAQGIVHRDADIACLRYLEANVRYVSVHNRVRVVLSQVKRARQSAAEILNIGANDRITTVKGFSNGCVLRLTVGEPCLFLLGEPVQVTNRRVVVTARKVHVVGIGQINNNRPVEGNPVPGIRPFTKLHTGLVPF